MYLKVPGYEYVLINIENKVPTCVLWQVSDMREWPENEELVEAAQSALHRMGWENAQVGKPTFDDSDEPYNDLYASVTIPEDTNV